MNTDNWILEMATEDGLKAEEEAREVAQNMPVEKLREAYVALCGMVAFYGKKDRELRSNPARYFDRMKALSEEAEVAKLLQSKDPLDISARLVKNREAVLDLLAQVDAMLGDFSCQQSPEP